MNWVVGVNVDGMMVLVIDVVYGWIFLGIVFFEGV